MMRVSEYIGIFIVLVGLLVTIIGFAQHRAVLHEVEPPSVSDLIADSERLVAVLF